jgi:hypothetical protein
MKYGLNKINIRLFTQQMGWWRSWILSLRSKDQTSQMTLIVINIEILTKYFIPKLGGHLDKFK